jgi:hypothetical protein
MYVHLLIYIYEYLRLYCISKKTETARLGGGDKREATQEHHHDAVHGRQRQEGAVVVQVGHAELPQVVAHVRDKGGSDALGLLRVMVR